MRERAGREPGALAWLEEAARFEDERGNLHAAQRHLASAIGIAPGDAVLEARYRALGERIAAAAGVRADFSWRSRRRSRTSRSGLPRPLRRPRPPPRPLPRASRLDEALP